MICKGHFLLADKDYRICRTDEFISPTKAATEREEAIPRGSRFIDLDVFRESLQSCTHCQSGPLSFYHVTDEVRYGLASTFVIKCPFCGKSNQVKTSGQHRSGKCSPPAFDINTRVVLGCLHAGIGQTHINNVLSTLNVPTLNSVTFKLREREVGKAVEMKCFSYAIAQNKGDSKGIQAALRCIVPHAFGDHCNCAVTWCGFKTDPASYKHKDLPYGKDLHGEKLQSALNNIFKDYCTDAVAEKLASMTNSQRNETLNSVVGSKNPKIRFYGGSDSNDFRIACGIAQTNLRYTYISRTLEALDIEPGNFCLKYGQKMTNQVNKDKIRKSSLDFKRGRANSHRQTCSQTARKEAREGKTYETGIGLNLDLNRISTVTSSTLKEIESIVPEYTTRPLAKQFKYEESKVYNILIFDTETTTTGKSAELCQLSATDQSRMHQFSTYVLPEQDIDYFASRSVDRAKSQTDKNIETVLLGHNSSIFDTPVLLRNSEKKLPCLQNSDGTFPKSNKSSLYNFLFAKSFEAHDALEDVLALRKIIFESRLELSLKIIIENSGVVSAAHAAKDVKYLDHRHLLMQSFKDNLYHPQYLKKNMVEKISGSGLSFDDLKMVYSKYGREGLIAILSKPPTSSSSASPRVSNTPRILATIVKYFEEKIPQ
ncbi:uncharacterized protein [Montipora foliosa]|uniref:uncharacterized protein n=1 Tax=Montipora foliosa TaxID=591990 RepID=UPI0035F14DCE